MFLTVVLATSILSSEMVASGNIRSNTMYKKTLSNKDALCNDGTTAIYYMDVQEPSQWIIFLESGAYCLTKAQCHARFGSELTNALMTSKYMPSTISGKDLLSTTRNENKLFYNYSRVLIPYCSSDAWLGTQNRASSSVEQFVFSGKIIFQSAIYELLDQGLSRAREVVLVGSSAGGVGAINHVQWLQDLMSSRNLHVSISVIIDGGWFLNFRESITSKVAKEFYIIGKPLSSACADTTHGYPCCLSASCMLKRGYYPSNVPTLFVFSMYDIYIIGDIVARLSKRVSVADNGVTDLITLIESYGGAMNQSLFAIEPRSSNLSYFVPACFQHTFFGMSSLRDEGEALHYSRMFNQGNAFFRLSKVTGSWLRTTIGRGNEIISLQSTLQKWFEKRHQSVRVTDTCLGPMCNPTCSESLKFVDTAVDWGEVLNWVILFLSLVPTGVCVAVKICFMVQLLLLARNKKRYLGDHKESQQVSGYGEAITLLLYSSSQVSNHSPSFENLEPEDFKERSMKEEDTFSNNTIFYRTAQYLRLLFLQNHGNEQFKSNAICKDVKCSENKENSGFSRSTTRNDPERRTDGKKDSCMLRIKNATLSFKQGEFIAIVGKHGAGKTKLLSLLSGKLKCGCKQKHLNMQGSAQKEARNSYIFLNQFKMPYYGEVTVRQYLILTALMRMSRKTKTAVKLERVDQVMSEMRLNSLAEETFDGSSKENLTDLQKRCMCLANQLITRPRVIFLDEPITGLDSASSIEMLNILKHLCNNGHLVIMTMQTLPGKTALMFNQLVLVADEQVIYCGDPAGLSDCYDRVSQDKRGLEDIISDILRNEKMIEATLLQNQPEKWREDDFRSKNANKNLLSSSSESPEDGGFLTRLFVIDYRASLSNTFGQTVYLPIMFLVFGVTAGIVYWQAETPLQIMTAYCGSSIPSLLFMGSVLHKRINKNLEIRQIESSENVGFSYEHVMQTFLSTSAAYVIPVIACSVLTYFMVFTSYNWWRFVLVTIMSLVLNQTWIAVYMLATYITPSNACHASGVIAALGGFSGGFIVTWSQMPIGYNLLFYVNPQFYGYSAITKILLKNVRMKCEYESTLNCISMDGNAVLARFEFDSVNPYGYLVIMLCITVLSLLFSWLLCDLRTSR